MADAQLLILASACILQQIYVSKWCSNKFVCSLNLNQPFGFYFSLGRIDKQSACKVTACIYFNVQIDYLHIKKNNKSRSLQSFHTITDSIALSKKQLH